MKFKSVARLRALGSVVWWRWLMEHATRFGRLLLHRFIQDGALQNTAALTYTTLLSLVPLMTVTLAVFAAFPVSARIGNQIQEFVFQNFVPASSEVIHDYLLEFAGKASRLTGAGALFLVVVALMLMANIDRAVNTIWHVRYKRSPLAMFMVYWAVLSLGPLLIGFSVALTSYLVSMPLLSGAAQSLGFEIGHLWRLLPLLASTLAFTLLYLLVPNRSVPLRHAFSGGILAAVLFELAKKGFAFYVTSFPTYEAIYGALAAVPIFLIWLYMSWLVTLLGAEFTYCLGVYRQDWRPDRGREGRDLLLAYRVLGHLWERQQEGLAFSVERLLQLESAVAEAELEELLDRLADARLVLRTEQGQWALARNLHQVTMLDLYRSCPFVLPRGNTLRDPRLVATTPALQQLLTEVEGDLERAMNVALADLFAAGKAAGEGA